MFEVLKKHFSYDWIKETISIPMREMDGNYSKEGFTIVHLAAQGGLFNLLHDVFLDEYEFNVDFYRPKSRLTLLHVVAKYGSEQEWDEVKKNQIKRLVERCNNLTLKNNMGSTILRCMQNCEAHESN